MKLSFLDRSLICGKIFESVKYQVVGKWKCNVGSLLYCKLYLMYIWYILCHFLFDKILLGLSKTIILFGNVFVCTQVFILIFLAF